MECCKAVSMAAVYGGDLWNDFFARQGIMDFAPVPLGVVVTETGAEGGMNGRAVITNEAMKVRTGRDYPKCNPRFALTGPAFACDAPGSRVVSDGFGTLSYMREIYFSKPDEGNVILESYDGSRPYALYFTLPASAWKQPDSTFGYKLMNKSRLLKKLRYLYNRKQERKLELNQTEYFMEDGKWRV